MSKAPRQAARQPAPTAKGVLIDDDGDGVEAMSSDLPQPQVEPVRAAREPVKLKPGEFLGRNGEVLSLKRKPDQNPFEIPAHLMDPEYTYEWKRYSVYGKQDTVHQVSLAENGWRPVNVEPSSPFAGYYMPADYKGAIIREDLMLMERPKGLTNMVREQERQRAVDQIRASQQRYTSKQGVETPKGFTTANPNVPSRIDTTYDVGPAQEKHIPIE